MLLALICFQCNNPDSSGLSSEELLLEKLPVDNESFFVFGIYIDDCIHCELRLEELNKKRSKVSKVVVLRGIREKEVEKIKESTIWGKHSDYIINSQKLFKAGNQFCPKPNSYVLKYDKEADTFFCVR